MATSLQYNYTQTRDGIINRAFRIIGSIGQGETGEAAAITEAAVALNDLVKEWNADGMPLWAITTFTLTPTLDKANYIVPSSNVDVNVAPLKVLNAWTHNTSTLADSPLNVVTRQEFQDLGNSTTSGTPNQIWYDPPGNVGLGTAIGNISVFPAPNSTFITNSKIQFVGQKPFENFNAATDVPDFPVYFHNALVWGLADQLAYEYGVNFAGRSMITKKALMHRDTALSFGTEEGSFRIQPHPDWESDGR